MKKTMISVVGIFAFAGFINAATIIVDAGGGADYDNIHAAVTAAVDGDSILVMSGEYAFTTNLGTITISNELYLIGSGYDSPAEGGTKLIDLVGGLFFLDANADNTVIKGFRMISIGNTITTQSGTRYVTIEENLFIQNSSNGSIYLDSSQNDTLRKNIIVSDGTSYGIRINNTNNSIINNNIIAGFVQHSISVTTSTNLIICNNLIINHGSSSYAMNFNNTALEFYSNILMNNYYGSIYLPGSSYITNNGFYANNSNGNMGENALTVDPLFENYSSGDVYSTTSLDDDGYDFHFQTSSTYIDAGRVGVQYNDIDGSQNDLGIYGGPWPFSDELGVPAIPEVISISVSPTTVSPSGTITISATGRIGTGTGQAQLRQGSSGKEPLQDAGIEQIDPKSILTPLIKKQDGGIKND